MTGAVAVTLTFTLTLGACGGGSGKQAPKLKTTPLTGVAQTTALLRGIPQSGSTLGDKAAPVTLTEYVDLQCAFCAQYTQQTLPQLIKTYVRTGKIKIRLRVLASLGADSVRAARVAAGAVKQDKVWDFVVLFLRNQKEQGSGYATDDYLHDVVTAVPGLLAGPIFPKPISSEPTSTIRRAAAIAKRAGVTTLPGFVVTRRGESGTLVSGFDFTTISSALDVAGTL